MFQKVIGKTCRNPECELKDTLKEDFATMCDCGHALEDVTATDKKKIAVFSGIMVTLLIGGVYLGVMKLKEKAQEVVTSSVTTTVTDGGKVIANVVNSGESASEIAHDPKAAITLVSEGLNLARENKFQEAAEKFSEATTKDQSNDQAWGNLGAAYVAMGKHNDALEPARKATEINPNNANWHLNLAEIYAGIGNKKEALRELESAINNGFADMSKLKNFNFKAIENEPKFKELVQRQ